MQFCSVGLPALPPPSALPILPGMPAPPDWPALPSLLFSQPCGLPCLPVCPISLSSLCPRSLFPSQFLWDLTNGAPQLQNESQRPLLWTDVAVHPPLAQWRGVRSLQLDTRSASRSINDKRRRSNGARAALLHTEFEAELEDVVADTYISITVGGKSSHENYAECRVQTHGVYLSVWTAPLRIAGCDQHIQTHGVYLSV